MAANKLNHEEAEAGIREIGTILVNLKTSADLIQKHGEDVFRRTNAIFFDKLSGDLKGVVDLTNKLVEAQETLTSSYRRYAEKHGEVASKF